MAVFYLSRAAGQLIVACLSSDTKPSSANGTFLMEIDTGIFYYRTGGNWVAVNSGGSGAPTTSTYLTETDESSDLPNSREVLAGTGIAFDDTVANERTVNLDDTAVTPGSYTSADITVDQQGRITAAASGGGGGIDAYTGYFRPGLRSAPAATGGNFTTGHRFVMNSNQTITGIEFYIVGNAVGKNVKVQLWDDAGNSLKSVTVNSVAAGSNTGTFASSQSVTAGTFYRISMYVTDGSYYLNDPSLPEVVATLYANIASTRLFAAGDANPASSGGSERYTLNPVYA